MNVYILMAHFCLHARQKRQKKLTSLIFYYIDENTYHKLPKIHQCFCKVLGGKRMEGGFAQIFYLCGSHGPLPQFFAVFYTREVDNHGNCRIFWKNCSFTECVPQKTTSTCVNSNPRGIEHLASSVVVQDNPL